MESPSNPTIVPHVPRLMALCREVYDHDGHEIGARPLAWALALPDGWTVTVPSTGEPSVSIWGSVREAARVLDAFIDWPAPQQQQHPASLEPAPQGV